MKIIFAVRSDYQKRFGGDVIQILKTKKYLEKVYQINVIICSSKEDILKNKDADLMHIFGIQTVHKVHESYNYLKIAEKLAMKTALSTIYWDLSYSIYLKKLAKLGFLSPTKFGKNTIFNITKQLRKNKLDESYLSQGYFEKTSYLLSQVNILLPNSYEEIELAARDFQLELKELIEKTVIVPNAVDMDESINQPYAGELPTNYILEVARIEVDKNQLNVIKALTDCPEIPIVFVGEKIAGKYLDKVEKLAKKRGNVYLLGRVAHEQLGDIYQKAAVHILPSFRESPGLATLEALKYQTNIVVSSNEYCPINYYRFNQIGSVCNPFNMESIKKSILKELVTTRVFPKNYFVDFSYEKAAEKTFLGYSSYFTNV